MKWISHMPVSSVLSPRLDVHDYKKDMRLNFGPDGADIDFTEVSGIENFIQRFKKVLLSEKTELFTYGLKELLPRSANQEKFNQECSLLASTLVLHEYSDSKPTNPNGLGYSIESISSIEFDEKSKNLLVTMKVTGETNSITIDVPLYILNHQLS